MIIKSLFCCWLLGSLLLSYPARAQLNEQGLVICLVPPVPELISWGGIQGIIKAIQQRVVYPPLALEADIEGRVVVRLDPVRSLVQMGENLLPVGCTYHAELLCRLPTLG